MRCHDVKKQKMKKKATQQISAFTDSRNFRSEWECCRQSVTAAVSFSSIISSFHFTFFGNASNFQFSLLFFYFFSFFPLVCSPNAEWRQFADAFVITVTFCTLIKPRDIISTWKFIDSIHFILRFHFFLFSLSLSAAQSDRMLFVCSMPSQRVSFSFLYHLLNAYNASIDAAACDSLHSSPRQCWKFRQLFPSFVCLFFFSLLVRLRIERSQSTQR